MELYYAQRLVAQALGRLRFVAIIVTGNPEPQFGIRSRSLGQVACIHVLGLKSYLVYYPQ